MTNTIENYTIVSKLNETTVLLPNGGQITITNLDIEAVGLKPKDNGYAVILITSVSIKKLAVGVTEKLELVSFTFQELKHALAFQNLLQIQLWSPGNFNKEEWEKEHG